MPPSTARQAGRMIHHRRAGSAGNGSWRWHRARLRPQTAEASRGTGNDIAGPMHAQIDPRQGNRRGWQARHCQPGQAQTCGLTAPCQHPENQKEGEGCRAMAAGKAEGAQWLAQHIGPRPGESVLECGVADSGDQQGRTGKEQVAPAARQQQQGAKHCRRHQLDMKVPKSGQGADPLIQVRLALLLHQGHQPLIQCIEMRPTDDDGYQQRQAEAAAQQAGPWFFRQAGLNGQQQDHADTGQQHRRFGPETFRHRQA
jgi:hypothetical protein